MSTTSTTTAANILSFLQGTTSSDTSLQNIIPTINQPVSNPDQLTAGNILNQIQQAQQPNSFTNTTAIAQSLQNIFQSGETSAAAIQNQIAQSNVLNLIGQANLPNPFVVPTVLNQNVQTGSDSASTAATIQLQLQFANNPNQLIQTPVTQNNQIGTQLVLDPALVQLQILQASNPNQVVQPIIIQNPAGNSNDPANQLNFLSQLITPNANPTTNQTF